MSSVSPNFESDSSIDFKPLENHSLMFAVPSNQLGAINQQQFARELSEIGWNTCTKSELGAHSLSELVQQIDVMPLSEKHAQLIAPLLRNGVCPLMWNAADQQLIVAVRMQTDEHFVRTPESVHNSLTEVLSFTFNPQRPEDATRLLILSNEEYDRIARHDLLTHSETRRIFCHQYSSTAVGAEIRDSIIAQAVQSRASDIHIEPFGTESGILYRVRYRIDGVLRDTNKNLSFERGASLVTSIKTKAEMDIADRLRPGDGQIEFEDTDYARYPYLRGHTCRVSTVPTTSGESAVVRVLRTPRIQSLTLDSIGFPATILQQSKELLMTPNGIILMTGPTGSGKTTTLYAMLQSLNDGSRKIYTIEQPVEMTIPGLTQTQVAAEVGRDFKTLLKTALRQDPDVILIGEIRDRETAETAVQAANTGHLVFATVHTNSAIATLARLKELGLESSRIVDNLRGVYAQRLIRTCCPNCTEFYDGKDELNALLKLPEPQQLRAPIELARPKADADPDCNDCEGSGYVGRQIVTELWRMTAAERDLLNNGAFSERDILATSIKKQHFIPLAIRGIELALELRTSLKEVLHNVAHVEAIREVNLLARSFMLKKLKLPEDN